MQKYTNRALAISFGLHIALMLVISPFLINHYDAEKDKISAEILEADPEKRVKRRVLPPRLRFIARAANADAASDSPASSTYAPRVSAPKAPVHTDVVPDVVIHADIPQTDSLSAASNASFGEDRTVGGTVVIKGNSGRGGGGASVGFEGPERRGSSIGTQFAHGTDGVSEVGLDVPTRIGTGLGIFGTEVQPGHGFIGEVYVPGGAISRMPNFDRLVPVYTFVTANLNVPTRNYTEGFPTPKMQSVIENFAIRFRAELEINTPGMYAFDIYSDDGSQLYINGSLVVNNDGIHPAMSRQGRIKLGTGIHPIEIHYFQGPRHAIALQWFYQPPNGSRQIVPPHVIYRPGKPQMPDALKKLQQRLKRVQRKKGEDREE